jgi:hypothetical protein
MLTGDDPRLQRILEKIAAQRTVATMLAGTEFRVRALKHHLVISNPEQPENGQIRIQYATGDVSWKREVWTYCGLLEGYESNDPDDQTVDAARIIGTLTSP